MSDSAAVVAVVEASAIAKIKAFEARVFAAVQANYIPALAGFAASHFGLLGLIGKFL